MLNIVQKISKDGRASSFWLAMVAGLGVVLMMVALGIGVVQGSGADGSTIGMLFAAGLILFILGAVGWFAVVQPQKHFDDITVPMDTGHHAAEPHDEHPALPETIPAEHH